MPDDVKEFLVKIAQQGWDIGVPEKVVEEAQELCEKYEVSWEAHELTSRNFGEDQI